MCKKLLKMDQRPEPIKNLLKEITAKPFKILAEAVIFVAVIPKVQVQKQNPQMRLHQIQRLLPNKEDSTVQRQGA